MRMHFQLFYLEPQANKIAKSKWKIQILREKWGESGREVKEKIQGKDVIKEVGRNGDEIINMALKGGENKRRKEK